MKRKKVNTIPSYTYGDTSNPDLKRWIDRNGDWQYYWKESTKQFLPSVNFILHKGYAKSDGFYNYLLNTTKEDAKRKLETKGEEGSRTHEAIRDLILGLRITMTTKYMNSLTGRQEVLSNDEWDNIGAWIAFCEVYRPEVIKAEFAMDDGVVAGTADFFGIITVPDGDKSFGKDYWGKRVLILLDWKSSSGIWPEYKAQTAVYNSMLGFYKEFEGYLKMSLPRFTGVLRLGTKHRNGGYELKVWDKKQTEMNLFKFQAALEIAREDDLGKVPEVEEIPMEYYIKLPQAKVADSKPVRPNKKAKVDKIKRVKKNEQ